MQEDRLRSVAYDPPDGPSIFDAWEAGISTSLVPPLSVVDAGYRAHIVGILRDHLRPGRRLVSVGAGNGNVEVELAKAGWDVLATDVSDSALRICRGKGLRVARLDLVSASPTGPFDMIYCDGVLGHLWQPNSGCTQSWSALALLAHLGSRCLVSNDLADDDMDFQLAVRSTPGAAYFRPPAGWFARDAVATSRWTAESQQHYVYRRGGTARRREQLLLRLTDAQMDKSE
jgi:SAM-dependent methyltransferase